MNNREMAPANIDEKDNPIKIIAFILNSFIFVFIGAVTFISMFHAMFASRISVGVDIGFYEAHIYMCVIGVSFIFLFFFLFSFSTLKSYY